MAVESPLPGLACYPKRCTPIDLFEGLIYEVRVDGSDAETPALWEELPTPRLITLRLEVSDIGMVGFRNEDFDRQLAAVGGSYARSSIDHIVRAHLPITEEAETVAKRMWTFARPNPQVPSTGEVSLYITESFCPALWVTRNPSCFFLSVSRMLRHYLNDREDVRVRRVSAPELQRHLARLEASLEERRQLQANRAQKIRDLEQVLVDMRDRQDRGYREVQTIEDEIDEARERLSREADRAC